jgi:hypothetical protein
LHAETSTPFALFCDSTATATLRVIPFHTLLVSPLETCGSKTRSAGRPTIGATPGAAGPPPPQRCTPLCPCLLLLYMDRAEGAPAYSQRPRVGRSALGSYVLASIVPPAELASRARSRQVFFGSRWTERSRHGGNAINHRGVCASALAGLEQEHGTGRSCLDGWRSASAGEVTTAGGG